MNTRRRMVPWIIAVLAVVLVAAILILGYRSFKATEKAAFDEFNQRQLVLAREAAGGIELYFENLASDMLALARQPEVQHFDETPARQQIQRMFDELEPWGVNDIAVLDAAGTVRYTVAAPGLEGADFSWRAYYQEAKEMTPGDPYIVEFIEFKGVQAGEKGILIAVPLFETAINENHPAPSGQFAGVVLCTLRLDTVTERFVASIHSSERGHAFLMDDQHNTLWSPDASRFGTDLQEGAAGFPAFQKIVARMSAGNSGTADYIYYEFVESAASYNQATTEAKLAAFTPIRLGNSTWAIGVWAPKEDARQLIRSAYITQLIVVGLSILVIVAGAAYLLRVSLRARRNLEREVGVKAAELLETNQKLNDTLNALEEAYAFQQSIIDGMAAPLMVIGPDYQIRLMNRVAREFSYGNGGASDAVFCYQVSHQHHAPCSEMGQPCPMEQVRESHQPATVIHEHYRTDGQVRFIEISTTPLLGPEGDFRGIIEVSRDITEQKKIEAALAQQMAGQADTHDDLDEFSSKVARSIQGFFAKLPSEQRRGETD